MPSGQPDAGDFDRPFGRILEEVDATEQRALAGAGPTEDDDDLALVNLHVDAFEHLEVAKGLVKAFHLYD